MSSLISKYDAFAIDLDGVVWVSRQLLPGAVEGIRLLREAGKPLLLLTNNATYGPDVVIETLREAGVDIKSGEVLNSAMVLRDWIIEHGLKGSPAYVLGEASVSDQLADLIEIVEVKDGSEARLVVVARDINFSFERLRVASNALRRGAKLVAMNRDTVLPTADGFEPGTGAILAAIEVASGATAEIIGKPELAMMRKASALLSAARPGETHRVLMIGDRLDSDVAGAMRIGWDSAIVLTGVTKRSAAYEPAPNYVLETLAEIGLDRSRAQG